LLDRLQTAVASRVTLLIAEAGYGKTTLLADFAAHSGLRTMWYRLDATDADIVTWANHLVAAAREIEPNFGEATLRLMTQLAAGGPPRSAFMSSVIGELGDLESTPTVLVLDDFHVVDSSGEATDFVGRILRDAPPWLSIIVSSRRRPELELGRITASGDLVEIGTDELRFSLAETVELFADSYGTPLDEDVLHDLDERTKGWAASLQLFHGSIRGRPPNAVRALARALSGASSPIYDFLAQEVLANLPTDLERFLIRSSLLGRVTAGQVVALLADQRPAPSLDDARNWIEEADRLALLSRSSLSTDARQLHPLLRDFLQRQLATREDQRAIREMHLRVARAICDSDPLVAAHHFLEAGDETAAMRSLGSSVMLTMGSGQWGVAADLIERIKGVPADPAVAAIRARRLIEEGDLEAAAALLGGVDVSTSPPDVRAVFRHTKLALGWRTGDRETMFATLAEVQQDPETPPVLRDIFQIFVDASPLSPTPVPYATLAARLERMAQSQSQSGHTYYAAISLHNAAIAAIAAGRFKDAVRLANDALAAFDHLSFAASERYSTYAVLTNCWFELGDRERADECMGMALASGAEHGDVPAEFAYLLAVTGERDRSERMLATAVDLERNGLSDLQAMATATMTRVVLDIGADPRTALQVLGGLPRERPLDVGDTLARDALEAQAHLIAGDHARAAQVARQALHIADLFGAKGARTRLQLILSAAERDSRGLRAAVVAASNSGELALLEAADAIALSIDLLVPAQPELEGSLRRWRNRWLPALRKQMESGATATGRAAAELLDDNGDLEDVVRLRAYAKTYSGRGRASPTLGKRLANRVAPRLEILDLGRVVLRIGDRDLALAQMRRKPAAMLMFLTTRPNLTATREQVLDQLWPDADPTSAANSLNQSLYFLRRNIDPWYEDDVSVEYLHLQGDLVWIDQDLCHVASADFLRMTREHPAVSATQTQIDEAIDSYTGQFAPEFEYEEWAISWRSRVHAAYLDFANSAIDALLRQGSPSQARNIAIKALDVAPEATDVEQKLIRAYWAMGARSAASAQLAHLAARDVADGLDPPSMSDLLGEDDAT